MRKFYKIFQILKIRNFTIFKYDGNAYKFIYYFVRYWIIANIYFPRMNKRKIDFTQISKREKSLSSPVISKSLSWFHISNRSVFFKCKIAANENLAPCVSNVASSLTWHNISIYKNKNKLLDLVKFFLMDNFISEPFISSITVNTRKPKWGRLICFRTIQPYIFFKVAPPFHKMTNFDILVINILHASNYSKINSNSKISELYILSNLIC